MPYIDVFHKGLHAFGSLLHLLLGHGTGDLARSTGDSGNENVGEVLIVGSLIEGLDDDSFLSSVASSEDDDYLSAFCGGTVKGGIISNECELVCIEK